VDTTVAMPHPRGTADADGSAMADLLRVTCRGCGTCFVSGHQDRRDALASGEVTGLEERCPHCGATHVYQPEHYEHGSLVGRIAPVRSAPD
jgi:ribosomal protein S27AE